MVGRLSERGTAAFGRAKALGPAIAAASGEIDRIRDIPEPLFELLVANDLFRLLQPRAMGGAELAPTDFVQILELVGGFDASVAWCLGQNNVCATVSAYMDRDVAPTVFRGPRDILAWGPGPAKARAVPGGYRIDGRFDFASGSRHATWLGANVPVLEAEGAPRLTPKGTPATYSLLFPRTDVAVLDTWHVLGLKGTGSDSYVARDLFVPESHAVPRGTWAPRWAAGPLYAFTPSTLYSSGFAGIALGIARAALDAFVAGMRDTIPRGARERRGDNNVVQSQVGQAEARIRSARMFLLGSLEEIWTEVEGAGALADAHFVTIRMATTWAIQQARETVTQLYLAAGASAIFESGPFEKRFRDIHTLCQQIQGHAAHFETVGQVVLGLPPARPLFTF